MQTVGNALLTNFVSRIKTVLAAAYPYLQVDAVEVGTFSARMR